MNEIQPTARPRYSDEPLPPYSYVPGFTPHPVSDPRGHMHGHHATAPPALDPQRWEDSRAYRYGIDLFNHGFYWEAHEAWETLWHAAGRRGLVAIWLKALIKLAAAAVKLREGNAAGALRHAHRSLELQAELQAMLPADERTFCGVQLSDGREVALLIIGEAEADLPTPAPTRTLDIWLTLAI
jgi:hypothetical protein